MTAAAPLAAFISGATLLSVALTGVLLRYAMRRRMIDAPGPRSAHTRPTPRGGGLAIVIVVLGGMLALFAVGMADVGLMLALGGGGLLIAVTGWIDDLRDVSPGIRAAVHFLAAIWAVFWLGGLPMLDIGAAQVRLGGAGAVLAVLGIVWCVNLYNFMDGIDGIAGVEAVMTGAAAGVLLLLMGDARLALPCLLVAGASTGFLAWNWPPARIFMGDVGSGLLGFAFPVLAIASENRGSLPLLVWLLLLAVFVFDSTATLVRRFLRGERVYESHARHAYQRAARFYASHARVTAAVLVINLCLVAAATASMAIPRLLLPILTICLAALGVVYYRIETLNPMWGPERSVRTRRAN